MSAYAAGQITLPALTASVQGWINHARYGNTVGLRKAVLSRPIPSRAGTKPKESGDAVSQLPD